MMKAVLTKLIAAALLVCAACVTSACSKDAIVGFANNVITCLGDKILTGDGDLMGQRKFAEDSFTGSYLSEYADSTVREKLFGNTSLERKGGNNVAVTAQLSKTAGSGRLLLERDGKEPEILLEAPGTLELETAVSPGSAYFIFEADDFTGTLDMTISDPES